MKLITKLFFILWFLILGVYFFTVTLTNYHNWKEMRRCQAYVLEGWVISAWNLTEEQGVLTCHQGQVDNFSFVIHVVP